MKTGTSRSIIPNPSDKYPRRGSFRGVFLLVLSLLLAVKATLTAHATTFIKDVKLIGGTKAETTALKETLTADGWTFIDYDLNKGCGSSSDYIYLLYKAEENTDGVNWGYITDFYISNEGDVADDSHIVDGRTYYLTGYDGGDHFKEKKGDLNSNTGHGSANIHLYYTKDLFPDFRAVTDITFNATSDGAVVWNGNGNPADLNRGCGSESAYIYMHITTATAMTGHQPEGRIDVCNGGEGQITLSGWAYDPDANTESIGVQVFIYKQDGTTLYKQENLTANRPRDDVNNTYHITGQHGYSATIDIADPGTYQVMAYAVDHNGDGNPQLGSTQTVTVTPGPMTVTIGNGTRTFYDIPFNMDKNYSLTEQIYTAEEIGMAGTITSIAFQYAGSGAFSMSGVQVYLKHTDKNDFGDYSMVPLSAEDKVFEGTFAATAAGWVTITLDTPFEYDGNGNLLVCCYDPTYGNLGTDYIFYWHDPGSFKMIQGYSNNLVPSLDGANWVSSWGVITETSSFSRNNIRFNIFPGTFSKPENLCVSSCTEETATLTWTAPESGNTITGYGYQFKKASDASWPAEVTTTATTATFSNLTADTDYDFRVRTLYGSNKSSYQTLHFTSATPLPYEQGFENGMGRWGMADCNIDWTAGVDYNVYTGIRIQAKHDGEVGFQFYKGNNPQYLISPRFPGDVPMTVLFYYSTNNFLGYERFQVGYSTTTSDIGAFTWGDEISVISGYSVGEGGVMTAVVSWNLYENNFPSGTKYIAVKYVSNSNRLFLDDFTFMANSGPKPTGLAVKNCTEREATLTWTAPQTEKAITGYAYQFKKASDASWSAEVTTTATTATISNLTAATDYVFRVKTLYDSNPSSYATLGFTSAVTLPYAYGFEDGLGGWTETDCYIYPAEPVNTDTYTGICSGITHGGEHGFAFSPYDPSSTGDYDQYLISPRLPDDVPIGLTFYYRNGVFKDGTSYTADFQVGYSTTTTDISAFTWYDTMTSSKDWRKLVVRKFPEGTKYVAVKWLTDSYYLYLDDVSFTSLVSATLADNADNTTIIENNDGLDANVTLQGRTFYRDGDWNTLCLPFDVNSFTGTPLEGASVKELNATTSNLDSNGTLTLNFDDATSIEAGKPYLVKWQLADILIKTAADWNAFAQNVNNGNTYADKTVRLMNNISISTMVGTEGHPFSGTFEGGGHTLDVTINASSTTYAAPFHTIGGGATIKNLTVTGNVMGGKHCAGLVGHIEGSGVDNLIWLCDVRTNVNCSSTHCGGVMGHAGSSTTYIMDTRFGGSITGGNLTNIGVIWGWSDGDAIIDACLAAGTYCECEGLDMARGANHGALNGSVGYKTQDFGNKGTYTKATGNDLASLLGEYWTVRDGVVVPIIAHDTPAEVIVNPVFKYVTVEATQPAAVTSTDGAVSFVGSYSPVSIPGEDRGKLFLGDKNTLYYPHTAVTMGSCRAYFQLGSGITVGDGPYTVQGFRLNFGDDATGIDYQIVNSKSSNSKWFDLSGRQLDGVPTAPGLYIVNGRKVIIK